MSQKSNAARTLVTAALIAAAYAALTYVSAAMGLAYGEVQFRLSEALCVLAAFTPAAIPGLTIGCVLGNITSPLGIADIVFGAAATLLSAVAVRVIAKYCGKATPFLSVMPPTVINAVIVGAEIVYLTSPEGSLSAALFWATAFSVAAGELAVTAALGIPFYYCVERIAPKIFG